MFNTKLYLSAMVASALSIGSIGTVIAQPVDAPPPPPFHKPSMFGPEVGPLGMIFRGVNLNKDQKDRIHDILNKAKSEEENDRAAMEAIHNQLANMLLSTDKVTEDTLKPIMDKQDTLEQSMKARQLKTLLALRDVFTPDQLNQAKMRYEKFREIKGQMKQLHMKMHNLDGDMSPAS